MIEVAILDPIIVALMFNNWVRYNVLPCQGPVLLGQLFVDSDKEPFEIAGRLFANTGPSGGG